jgi:hypothetical protein
MGGCLAAWVRFEPTVALRKHYQQHTFELTPRTDATAWVFALAEPISRCRTPCLSMLSLIVLSVRLLAGVIFALQNAQAITVRFLCWQLPSSVAAVAAGRDGSGASGSAPSEAGHSSHRRDLSPASVDALRQAAGGEPKVQ